MIGQVYGSYRITGKLDEGGMGVVYEAEHIHMGRKVAIKILLPKWTDNKVVVERFFNEARSSALADHQGIVKIFDCGFAQDNKAYLVMELLQGEPLSELMARERKLSIHRMASLSRQIAGALAAAHDKGIVHRDLKPDNIFVVPDRDAQTGESIKVLDFGIAKLASARPETTVGMLGTPLYMSPEQCVSSAEVDGRSDVYALGCIMFEMLCGRPPFDDDDPQTVATMQVYDQPPRPRLLRGDIPINVESLILRTLAKEREARPQSMADLRAELDVVWSLLPPVQRRSRPHLPSPSIPLTRTSSPATLGAAAAEVSDAEAVAELATHADQADPELMSDTPPRRSGWRRVATSVAIVAVAVVVAAVLLFSRSSGSAQSARVSGGADAELAEARPGPGALVQVEITTTPTGAAVYLDGVRVGTTPFVHSYARDSGVKAFRLELDGYVSEEIELSTGGDRQVSVTLGAVGRTNP